MPYIKQKERFEYDPLISSGHLRATNPGQLNFQLTLLCTDYLETKQQSYQYYNDVIGALEACKLEFYRRLVSPYEETKIKEHGDVY